MSGTSRQLNKQDCIDLRRQLADLGYGQAESEEQELLGSRLYPVSEHLRALDPRVVLVVGPRGSGKSALFKAFFSENRDLAAAIARWMPKTRLLQTQSNASEWRAAYPAGTDFPDTQALAKWVRSDEVAKKIWHIMLVRRLADRLNGRQREELRTILQPPAVDLDRLLRRYQTSQTSPTAALDEVEKRLQQEDSRIYIGYDELDTLGGFDWTLMARMVRGLVAFWSDYSRRWQRIRAKIFLRSDLFRRHAGFVRNWVLAHLRDGNDRVSPRSLVRLIEQAAGKDAVNRTLRPPRLIHPTALRQALDDVSDSHVTQGVSSEWPWLEGVKQRSARGRLVPWARTEIVDLLDTDWRKSWGRREIPGIRPPVEQPGGFPGLPYRPRRVSAAFGRPDRRARFVPVRSESASQGRSQERSAVRYKDLIPMPRRVPE